MYQYLLYVSIYSDIEKNTSVMVIHSKQCTCIYTDSLVDRQDMNTELCII